MDKTILGSTTKKKIEIFFINLCFLLFIARGAISFFKYPFLLIYGILVIYILVLYKDRILSSSKAFRNCYSLVFVLFIYLVIACIFSDKIHLMIIKDILNISVLLTFTIILKVIIYDLNDLKTFYNSFLFVSILFGIIISIQKIYYFFYVSSYSNYYIHKDEAAVDYNFASLPVFFGMISILYLFTQELKKLHKIVLNILLFVFSICFLLSGSKRGMLLFVLLFILLLFIHLLILFQINIKQQIELIRKNSIPYVLSFSFFLILLVFFSFNTSVYFKNNFLDKIGVKDKAYVKAQIGQTVFRYYRFINKAVNYNIIYQRIWKSAYDPKDPDSGWASGVYKTVLQLSGENVEIVPSGSRGYLLDSTCLGSASSYHAYFFLTINQDSVSLGDSIIASVYCYTSKDFDGGAALRAEGNVIGNKDVFYNLNKSGSWQKLSMPLKCLSGKIFVYLYINKGGVTDFSKLKGHAIFAYPEYKKISNVSDTSKEYSINKDTSIKWKDERITKLNQYNTISSSVNLFEANLMTLSLSKIIGYLQVAKDNDFIRNLISKTVSEDTTYHGYKSCIFVKLNPDQFGDDRKARWKFALEIFSKEYNWSKRIFGGGFNFVNWYGYYFFNDKTKSDYPHNPFLYILLYSGVIGLFLYIYLMYKVFSLYLKYYKQYSLFFFFFLVTYFFTFFSGGNPFDPPIMGFFVILPFFIQSIHKKDKTELLDKQ